MSNFNSTPLGKYHIIQRHIVIHITKIIKPLQLFPLQTQTKIPWKNINRGRSQRQALDKGIKIKILKGKLDRTQNSNATWIVTTINILIIKPVK